MNEILKRELNKTYLIIKSGEECYEESYELQMIMRNAPEMILPLHVMRLDGEVQLYYDISAKQSLKDRAERQKISRETVCSLFRAVESVFKESKEYMLDLESLVLDMSHIYLKENRFYFCYCPWEKKDSLDCLRGLLEEILGELDYHDTKGVELAYHLYQCACKGTFHIGDIISEHEEAVREERKPVPEEILAEESLRRGDVEKENTFSVETKKTGLPKKSRGMFWKILQFFLKKQEDDEKEDCSYTGWNEDSRMGAYIAEDTKPYQFEREQSQSDYEGYEGDTVLLEQIEVRNWRLQPVAGEYPVFHIREESFIVGKKREAVDGYIERNTISRIHSRLLVKEGRLFIMDANSTNGTFVNGESIEPGCEVEIFSGDRILFADVAYECYNSL